MIKYEVVPATQEHADQLVPYLRKADRDEVWASHHVRPKEAVDISMVASRDTKAGLANGRVMCLFGVAPKGTALSGEGYIWLLGHHDLPKHSRAFLRLNRKYIRQIRQEYDTLFAAVDSRNTIAVRWIQWLGFSLGPKIPYGPDNVPFHLCRLERV